MERGKGGGPERLFREERETQSVYHPNEKGVYSDLRAESGPQKLVTRAKRMNKKREKEGADLSYTESHEINLSKKQKKKDRREKRYIPLLPKEKKTFRMSLDS